MNGKLIVFEGGEGGGKTTQLRRTHDWLVESGWLSRLQQAGKVPHLLMTREPGGTELGKGIRQMLLGNSQESLQERTELLLYAADRAHHVEHLLKPELAKGTLILCDRYTDSTVAYQGYGRGLSLDLIDQLNQIATGGLVSDLTLWLDLNAAEGLHRSQKRGSLDRMEQADLAFHQRVRQGFATLAATHPDRITRIDASVGELDVAHQIQTILHQKLIEWYGEVTG